MKALILRNDLSEAAACSAALIKQGFLVICMETRALAQAVIHMDDLDLIVTDEVLDGQLTHPLLLSAERKNPHVSALMITDRKKNVDEMYDLIPCIYGLVGSDVAPEMIGTLGIAAVENKEDAAARITALVAQYDDLSIPSYADIARDIPELAEEVEIVPFTPQVAFQRQEQTVRYASA